VFKGFCACLAAAVAVLLLRVGASAHQRCTVTGTPGPDVLHGTDAADVICGGGGNDVLAGGTYNIVHVSLKDFAGNVSTLETTGEVARLVSGTLLDGTWRLITKFAASAPTGPYHLAYIGVRDLAGNGGPVQRAELEARGLEAGFTKLP